LDFTRTLAGPLCLVEVVRVHALHNVGLIVNHAHPLIY